MSWLSSWLSSLPAALHLTGGVHFMHPAYLLLLLLLPIWWWYRRFRRLPAITFSRAELLARGPVSGGLAPKIIFLARNLVIIGLIVAVARPRSSAQSENVTTQGINIVLAVDLSSSMLSEDFQPSNRLEVAKETMKRFVQGRASDRIGVIAFAAEALTQVPLTTDYPVVLQAIENLQAGQLEDGTAIGTGIATAANRLRNAPGATRVMILLTDGVNNRGSIDPRTAAQAAGALGIKIYTIGVGTEGLAPVPVGRGLYGLRFEMQPVEIDEKLLSEISRATGGQYFRAHDAAALGRIYSRIDALERSPIQSTTYVEYHELFRWPLGLAILALLLEVSVSAVRAPLP